MTPTRRSFLKHLGLVTFGSGVPLAFGDQKSLASLARSTPEAEGVASAAILDFLEAMVATKHELHSFMLLRHGKVISEGWWSPYGADIKHTMYSMSKSFTSTAIGFAVSEGKLSVDDKVTSFFPKDLPEMVSENLAALRVKDLLSMSVGNEKEPTQPVVHSEDWVKTFLAQSITHTPGTQFMYNSAATYMCSAIVTKLTGMTVLDYLKPRLFEPLGITGMTWETCPKGINTGGWGLSIRTEGLAKFGQLYLQRGQWNGKQVLPAKWVEEATTFKIQQPGGDKPDRPKEYNDWLQGYCYQFWRCQHGGFRGDGAFGQFTIVLPEQDAVLVMTSETKDMQGQLDLVYQHLLPAMKDKPLPPDASSERLAQTTKALEILPPKGQAGPVTLKKTFTLEANSAGFTTMAVTLNDKACELTLGDAKATHQVTSGIGQWQRGETTLPAPRLIIGGAPPAGTVHVTAASACWRDEHTLELTTRYYQTPHTDTITCKFDGEAVTISFLDSLAAMGGKKDGRLVLKGKS